MQIDSLDLETNQEKSLDFENEENKKVAQTLLRIKILQQPLGYRKKTSQRTLYITSSKNPKLISERSLFNKPN